MTTSTIFVYSITQIGSVGAWSRYVVPFEIDAFVHLNNKLYIRSGDDMLSFDLDTAADYEGDERIEYFDSHVWWPWLDMGIPGGNKRLIGFDIVCDGPPTVSFGVNQLSTTQFTTGYTLAGDTLTGGIIPMPLTFPSVSFKVEFAGAAGNFWRMYAANLYVNDNRMRS